MKRGSLHFEQHIHKKALRFLKGKYLMNTVFDSGLAIEDEELFLSKSINSKYSDELCSQEYSIFKINSNLDVLKKVLDNFSYKMEKDNLLFTCYIKQNCEIVKITSNFSDVMDYRKYGTIKIVVTNDRGQDFYREHYLDGSFDKNITFIQKNAENLLEQALRIKNYICNINKKNISVIFTNGTAGYLIHEIVGHLLEADVFFSSFTGLSSYRKSKIQGPKFLNVIDDAHYLSEYTILNKFDDEATPIRKAQLIENGVIKDLICDKKNIIKMSTNNLLGCGRREDYRYKVLPRMRGTYICTAANITYGEMVKNTENGILISQLYAGWVNPVDGNFILNGFGYAIEEGKKTKYIDKLEIKGNVYQVLEEIEVIGNDFYATFNQCHKNGQSVPVYVGSPSVKINNLSVNGVLYE